MIYDLEDFIKLKFKNKTEFGKAFGKPPSRVSDMLSATYPFLVINHNGTWKLVQVKAIRESE